MAMRTINGIALPDGFDFTEADAVEAFEAGNEAFTTLVNTSSPNNMGSLIRAVCDCVREWLDSVVEEGFGERCVPTDSFKAATIAANDLIDAYSAGIAETVELQKQFSAMRNQQQASISRSERRKSEHQKRSKPKRDGNPYNPERLNNR